MNHAVNLMVRLVKVRSTKQSTAIDSDRETKSTSPCGLKDNNTNVRQDDHI